MGTTWKEVTSTEEIETIYVHLPPLAGIRPVIYVPILWSAVVVLVLFLALVLPGIHSYGTLLTVESSPAGAQVLVDGTLRGTTPIEVFVSSGERIVEVRLAGFEPRQEKLNAGGRRFGSAFFPLRAETSFVFSAPDRSYLVEKTLQDFSSWALGMEPGAQFQHPPVARDGARALWAQRRVPSGSNIGINDFSFVVGLLAHGEPHQAADILGAATRVANPGGIVNITSLAEMVRFFVQADNTYQGLHRVLGHLDAGRTVEQTAWYRAREDRLTTDLLAASLALDEYRPQPVRRRTVNGLSFVLVEGGVYATGYPLRDESLTGVLEHFKEDFWIQTDEVSRGAFARFIAETPEWEPQARSEEYYLDDWPADWRRWLEGSDPAAAAMPVRYVTREAARSFARWVEARSNLSGERIVLPSAAEWEYAAFLNDPDLSDLPSSGAPVPTGTGPTGALGARRMSGSLWEWTGDWYGRFSHVVPAYHGAHAVVMGGSFANSTPSHSMRGSQPPDRPTPFLGFRLAIVPEAP